MGNLYYGRGKDEDNQKLIKFLDEVFFSDDPQTNFLDLLPKIYKDKYRPAYNNFVVQDENGEFRSAVGNFYNQMKIGGEDIKACCIGNVAVGREYRSMGYMKELMKLSVEDMKNNGVDMAYLGGQRQRYGYFGFEPSGVRIVFNFNRQTIKHALKNEPSGLTSEPLREDDIETMEKIAALYERYPVISVRDKQAYFDILCSWNSTPYILKENGEFVGYFVTADKISGVSALDVVDPKYFGKAILAVFELSKEYNIEFPTAPFEVEKVKFCNENCEGMSVGGCESILVYNFEKVIRAFMKAQASYRKLCDGELKVLVHGQCGDEKLRIAVKNNEIAVERFDGDADIELGHHEATRAFFSNFTSDRALLAPEAQQWFPLPSFLHSQDTM